MANKFFEVVLEGHEKAMYGLLEGFMLAGNIEGNYYFSKDCGIESETFMDAIIEWVSLKAKLHHVIMEESILKALEQAIKSIKNESDLKVVNPKIIKSSKELKDASFTFEAKAYGKKYGEEIKNILTNTPSGIKLEGYKPTEIIDKDAKGAELYAPEHDYIFEAGGTISGNVKEVIEFRKILDDHPLINPDKINI